MPTKSHKCTLIPGDIEAAKGAGKLVGRPAGEPYAHRLREGREAVVPYTVEAYGEPQNRNGEVTPGDRQHKAAAGRAHGEGTQRAKVPASLMLCGARTSPLARRTPSPTKGTLSLSPGQGWMADWLDIATEPFGSLW